MTAEEKARELIEKFKSFEIITYGCRDLRENPCIIENPMLEQSAKQCALICVDEILKDEEFCLENSYDQMGFERMDYWQEVKEQLKTK